VVGLVRAVVHRARVDWPVLSAAWLLLLCATTLLSAAALYGDTVALGGIRRSIATAPPAERSLVVRMSGSPALATGLDPIVSAALARSLEAAGGEVRLVARSGTLDMPDRPAGDTAEGTLLASYDGITEHAELVDGSWAAAGREPIEATVSEGAAAALGLGIGDQVRVAGSLGDALELDVRISGIWRPRADDPYWLGDPLEVGGSEDRGTFRAYGPLVVDRADLDATVGERRLDLAWRGLLDVGAVRTDGLDRLLADVESLRVRLGATLPPRTDFTIGTALPTILDDVSRSTVVSRSGVLVLTIQFAVLAGYAILLVAGMLIDRRRAEVALLRSRGATTLHLVLMAGVEAILLAVPAAIVAPWLAVGIVWLLGVVGPLADGALVSGAQITPETVFVAAGTAAGCVLALTLPTVLSGVNPGRVRAVIGRGLDRTLGQRLGIDLALLVLAGVALWQLQLYGAPLTRNARGVLGADPLLVAAPAIGLLAGALVATRIIPRSAELAEKLLERGRGFVGPLGARQLARRPLRYTRSALLLMLAAALGTFAAAYGATWSRSQLDRAAYEAVADVRVTTGARNGMPGFAVGDSYRSIDGVESATPVARKSINVGRAIRGAELVALDAAAVARIATVLGEPHEVEIEALLDELAAGRPEIGSSLPAGTRRVAVTIDAALVKADVDTPFEEPDEIPPGWIGVETSVVVRDDDGRIHRFSGPEQGTFDGKEQRLEVPLTAVVDGVETAPLGALDLLAVEFALTTPGQVPTIGSIDLRSVEAGASGAGGGGADDTWTPVPFTAEALPLEVVRTDITGSGQPPREVTAGSTRLGIDEHHAIWAFSGPAAILQLRATAEERQLAAIAGDAFAEAAGARVGDTLVVNILGQPLTVRIAGIVRSFAPLDPALPFLVVDGPTHELVTFLESGSEVSVSEWWLDVDDAAAAAVVATLRQPPTDPDDVIGRIELSDRLAGDPVALGVIGALGLGSLAALAFAAIGFVVSATASVTERLGEFALLQAVGLSARQLATWVSLENAFLLVFGLVTGSALGLLLSWLVLPFATLTESGATPVPTPVVEIPWLALLPLYVLAGIVLFAVLVVITNRLPRTQLGGVLRARDE
jgi:hypothetical protein